jgi:hypothetical protein
MVSNEISTGLNNAISRGESLESAKRALAMAGYNQQEIEEAGNQINMGTIGKIPEQKDEITPYKQLPTNQKIVQENNISKNQTFEKKKLSKIVIFLSILLLIIALGLTFFIQFGDEILATLFGK